MSKTKFDPTNAHNLAVFITNSLSDEYQTARMLELPIERYIKEYLKRNKVILSKP